MYKKLHKSYFYNYLFYVGILILLFACNQPKKENKPNFANKMWDKFGIIGLGFFGTMTVGAPISIAVGIGFNVNMQKLALWCSLGVLVRCIVFTTIGHYGLKLF